MRVHLAALAAALLLLACGDDPPGAPVVIHVAADVDPGVRLGVDDLERDLGALTGAEVAEATSAASCRDGQLHVQIATSSDGLAAQDYRIHEERCGTGHLVTLTGGGVMSTQWAMYDLLERLGVRYFHPEQTYVPTAPRWPDAPIDVTETPSFRERSTHAHRTHPIELSPPLLGATRLHMDDLQRRWIDWHVANRMNGVDGWDGALVGDHAYVRGFPRGAGFNLLNTQQGGTPILDPDDPRPESEQLADAIDARMVDVPGAPPVTSFGFQFNPSEFTVADEVETVNRLTFITDYITEHYPGVTVSTINHGTAQPPGPVYGIRFFDLPQLAPPALGVSVHPLMFYGLDRAAPVYGNDDFTHFRDWIEAQAPVRRITWYPEGSWWLTFDLPVPLYLAPVTLEARGRDIEILEPLLAPTDEYPMGVHGHHLFSSGQEWGYWMIDYCSARMAWDAHLGWEGCLDWVTAAFADGDEIGRVLREVTARQVTDLRDPALLAMLVGSDDDTETGAQAGIVFHPLPPPPASLLGYSDEQVAAFTAASLDPLVAMAADYDGWADDVEATLGAQDERQAPWVREIRDGLGIFALRARHAHEVYATALALRAAVRGGDFAAIAVAEEGVARARAITDAARVVMTAREADYRYAPELSIAGDEAGTSGAIENQTVYPFRVLSRAHRLFYWTRPDDQLAAMFGAGLEQVTVNQRILVEGTALEVTVLADTITSLDLDWGDGTTDTVPPVDPHTYAAQGFYAWSMEVIHAAGAISHTDDAAVVTRRLVFAKGSLQVISPDGGDIIQGLLPGFVVGLGTDGTGDFMATGVIDGGTPVSSRGSLVRHVRTGSTTTAADFPVSLGSVGGVTVYGAVITVADGAGPDDRRLTMTGELATDDIVALVVGTGAFDEAGAREIVASTLGYTVDTLPARVPFQVDAVGTEP
ncbi:MAG: hypothetical protein KC464_34515 [Myxococcales bacterium]|nr:hypothetical protein [Myxococcales bacterium]